MNRDNLITCKRCQSNACYETIVDENTTTWMCMGCGYTSSTLMTEDSQLVADTLETSPTLYSDIKTVTDDKNVWFPATLTLPGQGMVFADGTDKDNWKWSAILSKTLTETEIKSGKFPADQTFKMDMKNMKGFNKDRGFMDALEYIGFFQIPFAAEDKEESK